MSQQDTQAHLERHHRGAQFHDLMFDSFARRFDPSFWSLWDAQVKPTHGGAPVYVDLGCGPGLMLRAWRARAPAAVLHAVEIQDYMLGTARAMAAETGATLHEADLHAPDLPIAEASVDAVLSAMVLHELREPIGMLREARRLLRPTGRLVLLDWTRVPLPQYLAYLEDLAVTDSEDAEHRASRFEHFIEHNAFTLGDLIWLLDRTGFAPVHTEPRGDGQFARIVAQPL